MEILQVVSWSRVLGTNTSYLATGTVVMVQDQRVSQNHDDGDDNDDGDNNDHYHDHDNHDDQFDHDE